MKKLTLYHNPNCSKSRGALAILREHNVDCDVIEYLNTPPDAPTLTAAIAALTAPAKDLVRKDKRFDELGLMQPTTNPQRQWSSCYKYIPN